MKIEVGEYTRSISGEIDKVDALYGMLENTVHLEKHKWQDIKNIKAHSKNIIDLIEVEDYVNGMRVIATENRGRYNEEKQKDEKVILAENYDEWTENGVISNEDIKSIVTKEQFNSVMYKVVE